MSILAMTVTRANTPARARALLETFTQGQGEAGIEFDWVVYCQEGTLGAAMALSTQATGLVKWVVAWPDNKGQHVAFNDAYERARTGGYDHLLRIDDDCQWRTKRWLVKMLEVSAVLEHKALVTPAVRGLKFPPPRFMPVTVKGHEIEFLEAAIGGLCRLHPMGVLTEHKYVSDVRLPLGSGDASGIGEWAVKHMIPMAWAKSIRATHTTSAQEESDGEHFILHDLFQRIPYIPAWQPPVEGVEE